MGLSSGELSAADVAAVVGSNKSGFGGFGEDGAFWIIVLFLFALMGGWNNNGNGGGFGGGGGNVQQGFDQAAIMSGINSLTASQCAGFSNAEVADSARQMSTMQQLFANQTAMNQGFNNLQSQFAQCCCDNKLLTAQTQALVQSENCADREALSNGIRDIISNQNSGVQRIIDQLCSDKIDAKNEKIADLERQLTMANLAASQTAQTSRLLADNSAQTQILEQYLNPVPIPAYIVQNPNCCSQNYGCSCGGTF